MVGILVVVVVFSTKAGRPHPEAAAGERWLRRVRREDLPSSDSSLRRAPGENIEPVSGGKRFLRAATLGRGIFAEALQNLTRGRVAKGR
ncbi:hypothetical protein HMPREF9440_01428 [Sutterella parvirubra YIT 11816]|uniref:Uncharacterized protein n=1 Tax=Sutterella parvirubra YIT 11816 TaxID=762967 RepID=H3KFB2_9BURK|nr:hypothetical protein HMPREF9440_01428 [Sutterella parvirubra YIT 11816]